MEDPEWSRELVKELDQALSKLEPLPGMSFRGDQFQGRNRSDRFFSWLDNIQDGVIEWDGFVSSTRKRQVTLDFIGGISQHTVQVIYEIEGATGIDIKPFSNWEHEQETLFKRGSKFKVTNFDKLATWLDRADEEGIAPFLGQRLTIKLQEITD